MPDSLEYFVRPFVSPNAHGNVIIPSAPAGSRERATITWGKPTVLPPVQAGVNFQVVCCKDTLSEDKRKTEKVRIYQGGDPSSPNYIDWEPPLSMDLNKKEQNNCGDNWDDISGVAQAIDSDLAGWQSLMDQVTGTSAQNCGATWNFKSQLS
jgi:hypothetical protein